MAALPSRGFRSAMDDFGTGYSSLNMLKEIALDVLKLDIAFFRDTEGTPRERAVVESHCADGPRTRHVHRRRRR